VTQQIIESFSQPDGEKIEMLRLLSRRYPIVVCSNSIRRTVDVMLAGAGLSEFIDFTLSNEDIERSKPDPEVYVKAFERLGVRPDECVVIEDSDVGKAAATASGAVLCSVNDPADVNYYRVMRTIRESDRINVVIPAAGQGKRFAEIGYQHPKPLIDVEGRPMIDLVLENFRGVGRPIVLLQDRHVEQYCADSLIRHLAPEGEVVGVDGLTEGATCTVLLAEHLIDSTNELVLANSDQVVDVSIEAFVREMRDRDADGGILTFRSDEPKWSYARTDDSGRVTEVAEKIVISNQATVGIYYFRHGSDFVRFAKQMIAKDIRVNGEFYVCPVFNQLVQAGLDVYISEIDPGQMHGLGTPEDLETFVAQRGLPRLAAAA
jgi:HAD superfamily hydrolase (TIGR01509 family)